MKGLSYLVEVPLKVGEVSEKTLKGIIMRYAKASPGSIP